MPNNLVKKAVFEIDKYLQQTVGITTELEETVGIDELEKLRKLQKIYAEANDWCKAILYGN